MFSWPSIKPLCHLKTLVIDRVASTRALIKEVNGSTFTNRFNKFYLKFDRAPLLNSFLYNKHSRLL